MCGGFLYELLAQWGKNKTDSHLVRRLRTGRAKVFVAGRSDRRTEHAREKDA